MSHGAADHLMATFYAPVYQFASMVFKKSFEDYSRDCRKPMKTCIFATVSHCLLDLHCQFGMVLPILMKMRETAPAMYRLLTPDTFSIDRGTGESYHNDLDGYSKLIWLQRTDDSSSHKKGRDKKGRDKKAENEKGWSNFPIMVWIVGFLIEKDIVTLVHGSAKKRGGKLKKAEGNESVDYYMPSLLCQNKSYTLSEFILFLLFHPTKSPSTSIKELLQKVQEQLVVITKDIVYKEIASCFTGQFKYGQSLHKKPADVKKEQAVAETSVEHDGTKGEQKQETPKKEEQKQETPKKQKKKTYIEDDDDDVNNGNIDDDTKRKAEENRSEGLPQEVLDGGVGDDGGDDGEGFLMMRVKWS